MFSALIHVLGWSLIHSLWQSALLFVVIRLLLPLLKKGPARLRYLLAAVGMAGVFLSFLFTFYTLWQQVPATAVWAETATHTAAPASASPLLQQGAARTSATPGFFQDGLLYLVLLYAAGLVFFIGKSLRDLVIMQYIRHNRIRAFDPAWDRHLQKLANGWNIRRKVGLYLSEKVDVPAVIGYLKPIIYLPVAIANHLTPEQIEAILLHELAHIKRGDFIINLLQNMVETVLFFNPFVWWLSRQMNKERELACDEMVLGEKEPQLYARSLLALAENRTYQGRFVLAAADRKQDLLHRIKTFTTMKTQKTNALQKALVLLSMVIALFSISWLVPYKPTAKAAEASATKAQTAVAATQQQDTIPTATLQSGSTKTPAPPQAPPAVDASAVPEAPEPPAPAAISLPAAPIPPSNGLAAVTLPTPPPAPRSIFFDQMGKGSAHSIYFTDSLPPGSFTATMDSLGTSIKHYFNSDEWKSSMEDIKNIGAKIRQEMNSAEWQAYRDSMRAFMHSKDWQTYKDSLNAYTKQVQQYFKSDEWKDRMASLKDRIQRTEQDARNSTSARQNNAQSFVNELQADGLLDTRADYKVRLDDRGLYINGRKQPDGSYRKYRQRFPDTKIKIKKDGNNYSSSFSSSHEDN